MKLSSPDCESCRSRSKSLLHFCHLDELGEISNSKSCTSYKAGQTLFHEGLMPSALFCINQGKIKIHKNGADGKEKIVRFAKPGDFAGYRAMMSDTPYSASATALEDTVACSIPKSRFYTLVKDNAMVASSLMKLLCSNLEESEQKLTEMAYKPVRERLAESLLLLERTFKEGESDEPYVINFSRDDLAALVGTAKETVIRLLSEFKKEGIVRTEGRKIILLDEKKLLAISRMYD